MNVIKRDCTIEEFNKDKIVNAIMKAMEECEKDETKALVKAKEIALAISKRDEDLTVEQIQDMVEEYLMASNMYKDVARAYVRYRMKREIIRENDKDVIELLNGENEYLNKENSNKNATLVTTQRDYMAGIVSKQISERYLIPKDIMDAHKKGLIHFHDMDYFGQNALSNCCLINLEDMFKNGTVINGVAISGVTQIVKAMTIATQIITAVASSQYGGCTINLSHLAPFVRSTKESIKDRMSAYSIDNDEYLENELKKEIKDAVRTFNYQVNSMSTTNGQAPFISVFMHINDNEYEKECAMLIEEFLNQRYDGMPNELGVPVTQAFPKLLYILDDNNTYEGSEYYYLTELACKVVARRMSPDFVSAKRMRELKEGNVFGLMGATRGDEIVSIKIGENEYNNIRIDEAFELIRLETKYQNNHSKNTLPKYNDICGVYKLTHIPTGLYYIGSSKNIRRRLIEHRYSMRHKGALGDNYFVNDYEPNNLSCEILEECNIDDLWKVESKYVNFKNKDSMCVNQKDPINNGNFTTENHYVALRGESYSTFENKWNGTWVKYIKDSSEIFIKSNNEWQPIRAIMMNNEDSLLEMYEIKYNQNGEIKSLNITQDHPFEIVDKGRVMTENIEVGDCLIGINGSHYEIVSISKTGEKCKTYDFTVDNDMFDLSGVISHNCRSALSPWKDENGNYKFWGRFNEGVVTLNIPFTALKSKTQNKDFFKVLDKDLELCHRALLIRYKRLKGTKSDVAPILWQNGAFARLKKGETIDKLLVGGYATISLGYSGLYETVKILCGESLTTDKGHDLAIEILKYINAKLESWKEKDNLGYGLYGTPMESGTYKFATALKKEFGSDVFEKLDGFDRDFITNSYHVPVFEKITAFDKLLIESEYQDLTTGGAISYIEAVNMENNLDGVMTLVQFMYEHCMYAEINTKSDYCHICGSRSEMEIVDENNELKFKCPHCGNNNQNLMNVCRRICGYLSTTLPNRGRMDDIRNRFVHLDNIEI